MIILAWLAAAYGVLFLLFVFFVAVMSLRNLRDRGELTGPIKIFGNPALFVGLIIDAFANCIFPVWIMFVDWPIRKGQYLVTSRLQYYYKKEGYRGNLARWFCKEILHKFDECHCE